MKLAPLAVALILVGCGAKTTTPLDISAQPAPGTPACDMPASDLGTCVLCNDDKWHCAGYSQAFGVCGNGSKCASSSDGCVTCSAGATDGMLCNAILNPGGDNDVELTEQKVTCMQ